MKLIIILLILLLNNSFINCLTSSQLLSPDFDENKIYSPDYIFIDKALNNKPNYCYFSSNGTVIGIKLKDNSNFIIPFNQINYNKQDNIPNEILTIRSNFSMIMTGSFKGNKNEKITNLINNQNDMVILNQLKEFKELYLPHASLIYNTSIGGFGNYVVVGMTYQTFFKGPHNTQFSISVMNYKRVISDDDPTPKYTLEAPGIINYVTNIIIDASLENIQSFKSCHNKKTNIYYSFIHDTEDNQYIVKFNVETKEIKVLPINTGLLFETIQISEFNNLFILAGYEDPTSELEVYSLSKLNFDQTNNNNKKEIEKKLLFNKPYSPNYFIKSENSRYFLFYSHSNSSITIYDLLLNQIQDISLSNELNELLKVNKIDSTYAIYHGNNINQEKQFLKATIDLYPNLLESNNSNKKKFLIPVLTLISFFVTFIVSLIFLRKRIGNRLNKNKNNNNNIDNNSILLLD